LASKALKIVGIGFGVVALLLVVAAVAGGFWAKNKLQGVAEWGQKVERQNKELKKLDEKYTFAAPPKDQPVRLSEDRVKKYLAVRHELQPVLKKYEEKGQKFDKKPDERASVSEAFEAAGMMGDMMTELRAAFIEQLDKNQMSPREFHATTAAIYTATWGQATTEMEAAQKEALEAQIKEYEEQLKEGSLPPEAKKEMEDTLAEQKQQLAEVSKEPKQNATSNEIIIANAKLLEGYKDQVEKGANLFLDGVLGSSDEDGNGAFETARGQK
jgi:predicted ribosome quality control (RQC) complex YloA/Tae2 family protein